MCLCVNFHQKQCVRDFLFISCLNEKKDQMDAIPLTVKIAASTQFRMQSNDTLKCALGPLAAEMLESREDPPLAHFRSLQQGGFVLRNNRDSEFLTSEAAETLNTSFRIKSLMRSSRIWLCKNAELEMTEILLNR